MQFERLPNESDEDVIKRICSLKDTIGTWEDVANVLNDILHVKYTESKYRKQYASLTASAEYYELLKERKKIQTEKIEYNRLLRERARDELITEKIVDAIKALPDMDYRSVGIPVKETDNNRAGLFVFSDCHFGIEFCIKDLAGNVVNKYNSHIFVSRMEYMKQCLLDAIKRENLSSISIWELGDSVQGMLRLGSQLKQLQYGVIESAVRYAEYIAEWLNDISQYVDVKFQMVSDSNHNQLRLLGQPKNSFPDENMSYVIREFLKIRLRNNNHITIAENPTGMNFETICGFNILGIHGEVKNLSTAIHEFTRLYHTDINYLISGHIHHSQSKEVGTRCNVLSVGSVIGIDPYATSQVLSSTPKSNLFIFNEQGKAIEYTFELGNIK